MNARPRETRTRSLLRLLSAAALLVLTLVAVPSLHAQRGGDPAARVQQQVDRYTTSLKLTPAQAAQVKTILTKQSEDMRALMESANGDMSSVRGKMAPLRAASEAKIEAVLTTPEQKAAFAALKKEQAERRTRMQPRQ